MWQQEVNTISWWLLTVSEVVESSAYIRLSRRFRVETRICREHKSGKYKQHAYKEGRSIFRPYNMLLVRYGWCCEFAEVVTTQLQIVNVRWYDKMIGSIDFVRAVFLNFLHIASF
jgi:hypothetical protein